MRFSLCCRWSIIFFYTIYKWKLNILCKTHCNLFYSHEIRIWGRQKNVYHDIFIKLYSFCAGTLRNAFFNLYLITHLSSVKESCNSTKKQLFWFIGKNSVFIKFVKFKTFMWYTHLFKLPTSSTIFLNQQEWINNLRIPKAPNKNNKSFCSTVSCIMPRWVLV